MTEEAQPAYQPGTVVNGHILTNDGQWLPVTGQGVEQLPTSAPKARGRGCLIAGIVGAVVAAIIAVVVVIAIIALAADGGSLDSGLSDAPPAATSFAPVTRAEWEQIAKDPESAKGRGIVVYAEVTQFDAATGDDALRANVGAVQPTSQFELDTNTILQGDQAILAPITQGDVLKVNATVAGSQTYENVIGGGNTAPVLLVSQIEKVGFLDLTPDAVLGAPVAKEFGGVAIPVTIRNSGDLTYNYSVEIAAVSADGAQQFGTTSVFAQSLAPGQTTVQEASFFEDIPEGATYKVTKVDRNSF